MGSNQRKKSTEKGTKVECGDSLHQKSYKYKFNISMDNLKCFINPTSKSTPKPNKPTSQPKDHKLLLSNECKEITLQLQKESTPNNPLEDITKELSNEIISQIENNGLSFPWNDNEEVKSEYHNQEESWEVNEFLQTFSEECANSYSKSTTFNSTIDPYSNLYYQSMMVEYSLLDYTRSNDPNVFEIYEDYIGADPRTTLMIKNIPNKYTIQNLSMEIDQQNANNYDFLYLPCDIKNNCNIGYGFINFINTDMLRQFYFAFHHKKWQKFRSEKICMLTYARLQGLSNLIEHFQNTKVLNHKDKKYQPIIRKFDLIENLIRTQQEQL